MTLTPGTPIGGENASELRAGDLWRDLHWGVMRFDRFDDSQRRAFCTGFRDGQVRLLIPSARGTFIGRPDADGWIEWSGGDNPVPGRAVEVRWSDGEIETGRASDTFPWHWQYAGRIIAFRLTPFPEAEQPASADGVVGAVERIEACWADPHSIGENTCWMTMPSLADVRLLINDYASMVEEREKDREALEDGLNALSSAAAFALRVAGTTNPARNKAIELIRSRLQARTGAE